MFHPKLLVMMLVMGCFALWIYCLVDVIRSTFKNENQKLIWIILLAVVPVIGVVLYIVMGRDQKAEDRFSDEL
jgi:hypothetical protein